MLKIELSENGKTVIQAAGPLKEIVAELGIAIGGIYAGVNRSDGAGARDFKRAMQRVMMDDSPAWSGEILAGGVSIVLPRE